MYAYTDETGNSRLHAFDDAQPLFWTLTAISPVDLDKALTPVCEEACRGLGVDELHGNELGWRRLETIAAQLQAAVFVPDQGRRALVATASGPEVCVDRPELAPHQQVPVLEAVEVVFSDGT